jgi:hypothetical protein
VEEAVGERPAGLLRPDGRLAGRLDDLADGIEDVPALRPLADEAD